MKIMIAILMTIAGTGHDDPRDLPRYRCDTIEFHEHHSSLGFLDWKCVIFWDWDTSQPQSVLVQAHRQVDIGCTHPIKREDEWTMVIRYRGRLSLVEAKRVIHTESYASNGQKNRFFVGTLPGEGPGLEPLGIDRYQPVGIGPRKWIKIEGDGDEAVGDR